MPITWVSIDPAKSLGVAFWQGHTLTGCGTLVTASKTEVKQAVKAGRPLVSGKAMAFNRNTGAKEDPILFPSLLKAYEWIIGEAELVVIENPMGYHVRSVAMMAWIRGYIAAIADVNGARCIEVNNSEWTRVASEAWNVSWPRDSALRKQLAIKLTLDNFGYDCTNRDDEADAILIGHWAIRTRTVEDNAN